MFEWYKNKDKDTQYTIRVILVVSITTVVLSILTMLVLN